MAVDYFKKPSSKTGVRETEEKRKQQTRQPKGYPNEVPDKYQELYHSVKIQKVKLSHYAM